MCDRTLIDAHLISRAQKCTSNGLGPAAAARGDLSAPRREPSRRPLRGRHQQGWEKSRLEAGSSRRLRAVSSKAVGSIPAFFSLFFNPNFNIILQDALASVDYL